MPASISAAGRWASAAIASVTRRSITANNGRPGTFERPCGRGAAQRNRARGDVGDQVVELGGGEVGRVHARRRYTGALRAGRAGVGRLRGETDAMGSSRRSYL